KDAIVKPPHRFLNAFDHGIGIFAFAHEDDAFHGIGVGPEPSVAGGVYGVGAAYLALPRQVGDLYVRDILYQYGYAVVVLDDDIFDLVDVIQEADSADDIG